MQTFDNDLIPYALWKKKNLVSIEENKLTPAEWRGLTHRLTLIAKKKEEKASESSGTDANLMTSRGPTSWCGRIDVTKAPCQHYCHPFAKTYSSGNQTFVRSQKALSSSLVRTSLARCWLLIFFTISSSNNNISNNNNNNIINDNNKMKKKRKKRRKRITFICIALFKDT